MKRIVFIFLIISSISGETLTLKQCIEMALEKNEDIVFLKNICESSKSKVMESASGFWPQISANFLASRSVSPLSTTFGNAISSFPGLSEDIDVTTYRFGFSAQQNVWDFGRTLSILRQATLNEELSYLRYEKKKMEISYNVKKAYYSLLQAKAMEQITLLTLKEVEHLLELVKERQEQGMAIMIDVLNAETEYFKFKLEVEKASHNRELAEESLLRIIGKPIDSKIEIKEENFPEPEEFPLGMKTFEEYKNAVLISKIDLKEVEIEREISKIGLDMANSDWWPSIGASASYEWTDTKFFPQKPSWNIGLSITIPIFRGFSRLAKVELANYDLENAEIKKKNLISTIMIQAKSNYYKVLENKKSYDLAVKKENYLKNNFEAVNAKYNEGLSTITELIEAQTKKLSSGLEKQQLLYNYYISLSELEYDLNKY